MNPQTLRQILLQAAVPVVGTGIAFAFLDAGAFTDLGLGTLRRMIAASGLAAAGLGAGVTALLVIPLLVWQHRTRRAA